MCISYDFKSPGEAAVTSVGRPWTTLWWSQLLPAGSETSVVNSRKTHTWSKCQLNPDVPSAAAQKYFRRTTATAGVWRCTLGAGDGPCWSGYRHLDGPVGDARWRRYPSEGLQLWVTDARAGTCLKDCGSPSHWVGFDGFSVIHGRKKENRDWRWRRIGVYVKLVLFFFLIYVFFFSIPKLVSRALCLLALQQNSPNLDCFAHNSAGWSRLVELIVLRSHFPMQNSSLCMYLFWNIPKNYFANLLSACGKCWRQSI